MTWHVAAQNGDLGEGEVIGVVIAGLDIALYRVGGSVFATSDICSHGAALLSEGYLDGDCIECPLHRAQFDIRTGAALCEPADTPIATYITRVENDQIYIDVPGTP